MGSIKDVMGVPPEIQKISKTDNAKSTRSGKETDKKEPARAAARDTAEISSAARELLSLKTESAKYLNKITGEDGLGEEELESIKSKIAARQFTSQESIDQIADKLLGLPFFVPDGK